MPYKFNTKCFSLKERHPISKVRFENANNYIVNELNKIKKNDDQILSDNI